MKLTFNFLLLLILILAYRDGFSQDTAALHRVKDLDLSFYLEEPTYIVNSNYVIYEYGHDRKIIYADVASFKLPLLNHDRESGIALDKYGIYFRGKLFKADTAGFAIVGRTYTEPVEWLWKNKEKVYRDTTELSGVDAKSFVALDDGAYFKDNFFLYYFDKRVERTDPTHVYRTHDNICYDNYNIYCEGKVVAYNNQKIFPVNDIFVKTKDKVFLFYFDRILWDAKTPTQIDVSSLKGLSKHYSIDKNHVYFDTIQLPIQPVNFKHLKVWESCISDGINVYHEIIKDSSLDAATFGMIPQSDFFYDKNGIYHEQYNQQERRYINQKIPFTYSVPVSDKNVSYVNGHLDYFSYVSGYLIYDHQAYDFLDNNIYSNVTDNQILKLKAGERFISGSNTLGTHMYGGFFRVRNSLFYQNEEVKNIDVKSLTFIDYQYLKDRKHVYYYQTTRPLKTEILKNVDVSTFCYYTSAFYKDKNNIYFNKVKLIKSSGIQLLAIYKGFRNFADDGGGPNTDYYLFKNKKGFWLIETLVYVKPSIVYLGKTFNPKWNKAFENLELPAGL